MNLTPKQLRRAADIQERIEKLQKELNSILGTAAVVPVVAVEKPAKKKRHYTAESKAKMRKAQQERWAKFHAKKKVADK